MAKFLLEDGKTVSYDELVRNHHEEHRPTISPTLMVELRMIDTLKEISNNLKDTTLDKTCIMQLIKGEPCECNVENKDCHKCICHWYMDRKIGGNN